MNFSDFLKVVWRRRWTVLLIALLTTALGVAFAVRKEAEYVSTATVVVTPQPEAGFVPSDNLATLLETFATTAESSVNEARAERILGRSLPGEVETSTEAGTGVLRISGRAADPSDARETASAATEAFIDNFDGNALLTAELIDPAPTPSSPAQPRPPVIIGTALVVGLGFGLLFAFAIDGVRRRIETGEELLELTGTPTVARLRRSKMLSGSDASLIWHSGSEVALQEEFRLLRTNLRFMLTDVEERTIQVTSAIPRQGKSTVIANLGVALAQVGVRTTIIDADMRRPTQHEIFRLDNAVGLSTALSAPGSVPAVQETGIDNLYVLPSGPPPESPSELLSTRLSGVLNQIRARTGIVLLDSPPLLAVSDARLIAHHADGVLVVVTKGTTKPSAVTASIEKLEWAGARLLGFVLNRAVEDVGDAKSYYLASKMATSIETPDASVVEADPPEPEPTEEPAHPEGVTGNGVVGGGPTHGAVRSRPGSQAKPRGTVKSDTGDESH